LPIESIEHGARQMLGYGPEVEVIAPRALRRQVAELAARTLQRYVAGTVKSSL
jgi:predicted DNA-binding transcriptional regulator YafY